MAMYKVLDLFSGVGGLSLGAARAGFNVCAAVEWDRHAMSAHKINFPNTLHFEQDVRDFRLTGTKTVLDLAGGELTGVIGGPPCQGFSHMGNRNVSDSRNKLFVEFFSIVHKLSPAFFLAENVPGIIHPKNKSIIKKALATVKKEYILLPPMKLSAKDYGAPTTRTRVFFIGYKPDKLKTLSISNFAPSPDICEVSVASALRGLPTHIDPKWQTPEDGWRSVKDAGDDFFYTRVKATVPDGIGDASAIKQLKEKHLVSGCLGTVHSQSVKDRYAKVKSGEVDKISKSVRLRSEGFCPTLRAGTGPEHGSFQAVRPLHPTENRVITPREAARLQGFPDWFQFASTKWHSFRQIGNSVSPILAEKILLVIRNAIR